jgi:hypothetical protein
MPAHTNQMRQVEYANQLHARSDSGGGGNTGIIVGAVCGCVAGLALVLFLGRLLLRLRLRKRSEPLPPVQPLAHHRERALAVLTERKRATLGWLEPGIEANASRRSHISTTMSGSFTSLTPLREKERDARSMSPATLAIGSHSQEGLDIGHVEGSQQMMDQLPLPNRPFVEHRWSSSNQSASSSSTDPGSPASPTPPLSASSSITSTRGMSSSPSPVRHLRQRSASHHSRPKSTTSGVSGGTSPSRGSALRGPPHSRHMTMQIVLPAPLAPELYPSPSEENSVMSAGITNERRYSVGAVDSYGTVVNLADAWVKNNSRSSLVRDPTNIIGEWLWACYPFVANHETTMCSQPLVPIAPSSSSPAPTLPICEPLQLLSPTLAGFIGYTPVGATRTAHPGLRTALRCTPCPPGFTAWSGRPRAPEVYTCS